MSGEPARIHTFSDLSADQYVIGDIHGCIHTLSALWDSIKPTAKSIIFCLGDYIHKGPQSKAVLDFLIHQQQFCTVVPLLGNHDQKLLNYFQGELMLKAELETLGSGELLDLSAAQQLHYARWLGALPHVVFLRQFILVHGGIDFEQIEPFGNAHDLMHLRETNYVAQKAHFRTVIHGHIPRTLDHTRQAIATAATVIPLDNGCVYPEREGMGFLSAFHLNSGTLIWQKNLDQT